MEFQDSSWSLLELMGEGKVLGNFIGIESSKNPAFGVSTCCHSANCGEFQTTRPRLQVPGFKASSFKSSCCNEVLTLPGIFHMDYFWLATWPFSHSMPTMESIWNPYGMDHSMDIPCASPYGFHVDSMEFTMNSHCQFMYYYIWIPWKNPHQIPWKNHQLCCQK